MRLVLILALASVGLAFLSVLAVYVYGMVARRSPGEPSHALPTDGGKDTPLDELVDGLETPDPDDTGMLLIADNLDAFAARVLSARNAGRSLDLIYYLWHDDLTGGLLAQEVIAAADRGVRVRLLLDDINTRGADPLYFALDVHENIEVRLFNPMRERGGGLRRGIEMLLRLMSINRRMHNKAWIADGRLAIVGGRNVGDEYFDAATTNFRDLDLLLLGAAVPEAEQIFDAFWNCGGSVPADALIRRPKNLDRVRNRLRRLGSGEKATPYLGRVRRRVSVSRLLDDAGRLHWSHDVRVVTDPPQKANGELDGRWLTSDLVPALDGGTKTLRIISPYFIPGAEGLSWLAGMAQRGIDIQVLTNSLAATDVAAVHGAYAPYRPDLLKAGIRLFELQPFAARKGISAFGSRGASLHTKAFMVDGRKGFIGSFNFDPRSVSLNTEMGVLFESPGLVTELDEIFETETAADASFTVKIAGDGLAWEGEVRGVARSYRQEPEAGTARRLLAFIVGWLPIESQL
ncbi:phospholipase D family protein [Pararhizobium haloflavum]|uniref:phospholipase D family protein n=1 Tax=Pararhizobium haloflavum TaxID=2037914 RepID=UPI000C198B6C|nr:phospholipase D family protein [Pararhizobium haloflavum]